MSSVTNQDWRSTAESENEPSGQQMRDLEILIDEASSLELDKSNHNEMHRESELIKMLELEFDQIPAVPDFENSMGFEDSGAEKSGGKSVGKDLDESDEKSHLDDEVKGRKPSNDDEKSENTQKKDYPSEASVYHPIGSSEQNSIQDANLDFNDFKSQFDSDDGRGDDPEVDFLKSIQESEISSELAKSLVTLYEEAIKPESPLDYIAQDLGACIEEFETIQKISKEIVELRSQIEQLKISNEELKKGKEELDKENSALELECKNTEVESFSEFGSTTHDDSESCREELINYEKVTEDATKINKPQ